MALEQKALVDLQFGTPNQVSVNDVLTFQGEVLNSDWFANNPEYTVSFSDDPYSTNEFVFNLVNSNGYTVFSGKVVYTDAPNGVTAQDIFSQNGIMAVLTNKPSDKEDYIALQEAIQRPEVDAAYLPNVIWGITGAYGEIYGTSGSDFIIGSAIGDTVNGGAGADVILGLTGGDNLHGGSGHDAVFGQGGADTIRGGQGDDTIRGGASNDVLWGGAGADLFVIGQGQDTIKDFTSEDSILITGVTSLSEISFNNGELSANNSLIAVIEGNFDMSQVAI